MNGLFILDGRIPKEIEDVHEWATWYETAKRHVADERILGCRVSTIFLGIDHQYGAGPPLVFETMIFGGPLDQEQDRCSTWEQAEAMHKSMVDRVKASMQ